MTIGYHQQQQQQRRLILTPNIPTPLGRVSLRPEVAKLVDPDPDFDLLDVRVELERIEAKYGSAAKVGTPSSSLVSASQHTQADSTTPAPTTTAAKRFGGNVSDVADFGRGGFRVRLLDSDLYSDEDEEDAEDKVVEEDDVMPLIKAEIDHFLEEQHERTPSPARQQDWDWAKPPLLPKADEIETALREINREMLLKVQEETKQTQVSFDEKFKEEQRQAAARFAQLESDELAKKERAQRNDKQDQRAIAEARDQHLSILQRETEQRTQVEERAIKREAAAEEARKRELERARELQRRAQEEAEALARRRADAEREKVAADAAKRKAQADAAAAAALQRAEAESKLKREAEQKAKKENIPSSPTVPKPRVSEQAAKQENARLVKLKELQDSYKQFTSNDAFKKELKAYERKVIKILQQVSATQEQVRSKSAELLELFKASTGSALSFLVVTLGVKLLSQCESQVQKLPSFAFALAQVVVNVAAQVPFLMESILAQLHQVCIFTVPKYYVFSRERFGTDEAYYKALGYKEENGKLESTDDYVARMNAYMTFYAALTQTEASGGVNPHGLGEAWSWCSRLLNKIPANRVSASALESFLKVTGYRLFQVYPKPFMKLMQVVVSEFLVSLKMSTDADAKAVVYRLETYLYDGQYMHTPEGRDMPLRDISSQLRA